MAGMSRMDSIGELANMRMAGMSVGFGPVGIVLMFLMWAVMMVGMMVPSAAPMILAFAHINRRRRERGNPYVPTAVFLAGIPAGLDRLFRGGNSGPIRPYLRLPVLSCASRRQHHNWRHSAADRWNIPVKSAQERLPAPLPHSHGVYHQRLARGQPGGACLWGCTTAPTAWVAVGP